MLAKDSIRRYAYSETLISGRGSSQTLGGQFLDRDYVTRSPVVKGNFRDPKPHSYTTLTTTWPLIGCDREQWYPSSNYPNGPKYSVYRLSGVEPNGSGWYNVIYDAAPWGSDYRPTRLYNSALERMYDRLRGGLDLSVALGEAGTTAHMFKAYTSWDRFVSSLPPVKSRKDLYYFFPKLIGNSWLQFQYGWKPLISDVYNACDEATRVIVKNLTVRGSATERYDNTHTRAFPINAPNLGSYHRIGMQSCRIRCTYQLPEKSFSLARWTSLNPVSIAWELMPYSFVIDWFLDVGSTLRSLETALLYRSAFKSGYWSWLSVYDTNVKFGNYDFTESSGNGVVIMRHDRPRLATESYRNFQRFVLLSSPTPRLPRFEAKLGWQRLLSSAALLGQKLGRG